MSRGQPVKLTMPWSAEHNRQVLTDVMGGPRYCVLTGGRASGKSHTATLLLLYAGALKYELILSARETATSLKTSALPLYKKVAAEQPDSWGWEFSSDRGRNKRTGSEIIFKGASTSTGTARGLLSMEGITRLHLEEAQYLTEEAWGLLRPTVRERGSRILAVMNPLNPTDPIWRLANSDTDDVVRHHTTFRDNRFASPETLRDADIDRVHDPDRYAWRWLGELASTVPGEYPVLTYGDVKTCRDAYSAEYETDDVQVGFDVSYGGGDFCAVTVRKGPCIVECERWLSDDPVENTERAAKVAHAHGADIVWYDLAGGGSGPAALWRKSPPGFDARPVNFGKIAGPDALYEGKPNRDQFVARNSQMAEALRRRVGMTRRLASGDDVDPADCLFIGPGLNDMYLDELTRPRFERNPKMRIEKKPKGQRSPDMYDATALAFAMDSDRGLWSGRTGRQAFWDAMNDAA